MREPTAHQFEDIRLAFIRPVPTIRTRVSATARNAVSRKTKNGKRAVHHRKESRQMTRTRESPVAPMPADRNQRSVRETVAVEKESLE